MSDEAMTRGSILNGMVGRVTCPLLELVSLPLQSCDLGIDGTAGTHEQVNLIQEYYVATTPAHYRKTAGNSKRSSLSVVWGDSY